MSQAKVISHIQQANEQQVVVAQQNIVHVYSISAKSLENSFKAHNADISHVVVSGQLLITADIGGEVSVWHTDSWELLQSFKVHSETEMSEKGDIILALRYLLNNNQLWVATLKGFIFVYRNVH